MIKTDKDWPRGIAPPDPPPMRGGKHSSGIAGVILIVIFALAIGVACGWKMHG